MTSPEHRDTAIDATCDGDDPAPPRLDETLTGSDPSVEGTVPPDLDRLFAPAGGTKRIGRYVVLRELGRGAMGVVFAAYHEGLDRKVAIKVLARGRGDRRDLELRLRREARALAKLSHPNVVQVYDVGEHRARVFVAMEFIEGQTLREWMKREHPLDEIIALFIAVGRGLAAAHRAGVIHRDFKPENVLVGRDGRPRVLDFGLARGVIHELDETEDLGSLDDSLASGLGDEDVLLTQTGAQLGTPAYMSPEQHLGLPVGHGADQFGFCVALYEAVYDQRPFAGDSVLALALATQAGEIQSPPAETGRPEWLARIIVRGLSPKPEARFSSMAALVEALAAGPPERQRRRWLHSAAFAAIAIVAGGLAIGSEPPPSACPAATELVAARWPEDPGARLRTALAASPVPYATTSAREVERRFRRWTARWAEQADRACAATELDHEFSDAVLDRRRACLDRLANHAEALAARLARADRPALVHAVEAVAALPDPSVCIAVERLLETDAGDDARHQALAALDIAALVEPGDPGLRERAADLVEAALERDDVHVEAEARRLLARALDASQDRAGARAALLDALDAAETSDRDALVVELATELAELELDAAAADDDHEHPRLELVVRRLASCRARVDPRGRAHARATLTLAEASLALGELDEADALIREAALTYAELDPRPPEGARVHATWALIAEARGLDQQARTLRQTALREARATFGPGHPRIEALIETR